MILARNRARVRDRFRSGRRRRLRAGRAGGRLPFARVGAFLHAVAGFLRASRRGALVGRSGSRSRCHVDRAALPGASRGRTSSSAAYPEARRGTASAVGAYVAGVGRQLDRCRRAAATSSSSTSSSTAPKARPTRRSPPTLVVETMFDFFVAGAMIIWALSIGVLPTQQVYARMPTVDWKSSCCTSGRRVIGARPARRRGVVAFVLRRAIRVEQVLGRVAARVRDPRRPPAVRASACIAAAGDLVGACGSRPSTSSCARSACTRAIHNALLAQVVDSLATLFPATPGGAGTKQGLIVYLFRGQAISKALLLAFSVGMNIAITIINLVLGFLAIGLMARTLSFKNLRQRARRSKSSRSSAVRIGLSARDGARRRAGVHVRGRRRRRHRRDRVASRSAARRARGIVVGLVEAAPPGVEARPVEGVVGQVPPALVSLALWIADYYGSTPARALALVAPELPKRRKEQAPPAERQALGGEAEPLSLAPEQVAAVTRIVEAMDGGRRQPAALRRDRLRQDRGVPPGVRGRARARARRDRARPGDRARAADGRPRPRPVRRAGRDPALGVERCRAARRARADRERRGAHRRRRALGCVRAGRRARPDRRRRGARPVVQAGLRSPLRRAHRRREARRRSRAQSRSTARRRRGRRAGRRSSGSRSAGGSAPALPPVRVVDLRREAGYPLSAPLLESLRGVAERRGKAILLLNRRGIAPALHCRACGTTVRCPDCDVSLVLHSDTSLRCHHCGYATDARSNCRVCGSPDLARLGAGTQKLERELRREVPELELIRLDADAVAKPEQLAASLARFSRRGRRGAARHADGREGTPLRRRRARRGDRRRHGARDAGLPSRGADVPARHAARRAQRPRRAGPRDRADVPARLAHGRARGAPRRRALPRRGARAARGARLPAVRPSGADPRQRAGAGAGRCARSRS